MGNIEDNNYESFLEVGVWQGDNLIPTAGKFPNLKCYRVDPTQETLLKIATKVRLWILFILIFMMIFIS